MSDPTHSNLSLALLDQMVAGQMRDKTYAYVATLEKDKWGLGIAVANEPGYSLIKGVVSYADHAKAHEIASGMNEHIGLSADAVCEIIASTMGGRYFHSR